MYKESGRIEQRDTLNHKSHNSIVRQNYLMRSPETENRLPIWDKKAFCSLLIVHPPILSVSEKVFPIERWNWEH